jgi:hypothetical protein
MIDIIYDIVVGLTTLIPKIDIIYDIAVGLTMLHPGLRRIRGHRVILREKVNIYLNIFLHKI